MTDTVPPEPFAERVRSLIRYYKETGTFHWRVSKPRAAAGSEAGTISTGSRSGKPYRYIKIDQRRYAAHRLAWLIVTGSWPERDIDHRDTDTLNNSWGNLRLATPSQNQANRPMQRNNTAGLKGVTRLKRGKFAAQIRVDRKPIWLGTFDTAEAAHAAYAEAAQAYRGEFGRVA